MVTGLNLKFKYLHQRSQPENVQKAVKKMELNLNFVVQQHIFILEIKLLFPTTQILI